MSQRNEPYFDPLHSPQDDADGYGQTGNPPRQEWADRDADGPGEAVRRPPRSKQRSGFRSVLMIVLIVVAIVVVAAGGVFLASRLGWIKIGGFGLSGGGAASVPAANAQVIFSGNPNDLAAAPGNVIQQDTSVSPPAVWLRSRVKSASPTGATGGVSVKVPNDLVPRIEGRRVRVTVSARTGGKGEPSPFAIAYSAGNTGTSGWIVFVPTKTLDDYSFTYAVPIGEIGGAANTHYIGVWSDIGGGNAPLSIQRITIEAQ